MKLVEFDYSLPKQLIAQEPVSPRDSSRLMVLHRKSRTIEHHRFGDVFNYLDANDIVVLNNTKVLPVRLFGQREFTGGRVEILLLPITNHELPNCWEVLLRPSKRIKTGEKILFNENNHWAEVINKQGSRATVKFNFAVEECLDELGKMPVPPYIKNCPLNEEERREKYQTVYAKERGAIAAPTAGLHFTPALLQSLKQKGVEVYPITLHTGIGTFQPVREADYTRHRMEEEWYEIPSLTASALTEARAKGKRIVAVGTTVVRTLETATTDGRIKPENGWTDLFIYPGYKFKIVDSLITNFHIPRSTLLMLVNAFAGREFIREAYQEAIRQRYRFYSFGDAMLIL